MADKPVDVDPVIPVTDPTPPEIKVDRSPKAKAPKKGLRFAVEPKKGRSKSTRGTKVQMVAFKPGCYPIVFDTTKVSPALVEAFLPGLDQLDTLVDTSSEVYATSPVLPKINAEMQRNNLAAFNNIALALGVTLHTASSLLAKHEAIGGASTQYGMIHRADVSIPRAISNAVFQLGEMEVACTTRRYMVPDSEVLTEHLIRAASLLMDHKTNKLTVSRIFGNIWAPLRAVDPVTDLAISLKVHEYARSTADLELNLRAWRPFRNETEPWWWKAVFGEYAKSLAWLYGKRPKFDEWFQPHPDAYVTPSEAGSTHEEEPTAGPSATVEEKTKTPLPIVIVDPVDNRRTKYETLEVIDFYKDTAFDKDMCVVKDRSFASPRPLGGGLKNSFFGDEHAIIITSQGHSRFIGTAWCLRSTDSRNMHQAPHQH